MSNEENMTLEELVLETLKMDGKHFFNITVCNKICSVKTECILPFLAVMVLTEMAREGAALYDLIELAEMAMELKDVNINKTQ